MLYMLSLTYGKGRFTVGDVRPNGMCRLWGRLTGGGFWSRRLLTMFFNKWGIWPGAIDRGHLTVQHVIRHGDLHESSRVFCLNIHEVVMWALGLFYGFLFKVEAHSRILTHNTSSDTVTCKDMPFQKTRH